MKYTKLNKNWNAEPNAPQTYITKTDDGIELSFILNSSKFVHIAENDMGSLQFSNVFAYRIGACTEEEYSNGKYRFTNPQLPWGNFYELKQSNWITDFPNDKIIVDETHDTKKLSHYLFFVKDQIFECIASDFCFEYKNSVADLMDSKYPKGYLNYYISMFTANFETASIENYTVFTDLYIQMQGKKEFADLKTEIITIRKNQDFESYLKIVNYSNIENFGTKQFEDMIKVIESYKIGK